MSLCGLLGLNESIFHSLVVFWGAEFKKTMSDNVVKNPLEYNNFIKRKKDILLIQDQVDAARRYLTDLKNTTTSADHRKHVETLKQKHNCPECGGKLVEKTARTGQYAGKKITCCSNFPKCRYLKYH